MKPTSPHELRHGPYLRPRCKIGQSARCLIRGEVLIVALSNGPLRWPIGEKDGQQQLVIYQDLAEALNCEAPSAIAAEWGIPIETVAEWRQKLHPQTIFPATPPAEVTLADWLALPAPHQYSLLDLMYWMFWMAVLSALLRLMYGHTQISDKWHVVTTCLVASLALAAAWGFGSKVPSPAGEYFRAGVLVAILGVGMLLVFRVTDQMAEQKFSILELSAVVLGTAAICPVGLYIGSR